jgi:hypothetical protein
MKNRGQIIAALSLAMALAQPVAAWDSFGHMVVASVAYRNLDAKTKNRVNQLLALNPYFKDATKWPAAIPAGTTGEDRARMIFMLAATWPDSIKTDRKYHNDGSQNGDAPDGPEASRNTGYDDFNRHKYWHFVDQPFSQDGTDTTSFQVPTPNAETQIAAFRKVLNSPGANGLKSYDLVWLLHVIGDVHQPLHATTRLSAAHPTGDIGGNDVPFCSVQASTCNSELHAFWDNILGTGKVDAADLAAAGLTAPPVTADDIADAKKWINESFQLAQTSVYVNPPVDQGTPPFRATEAYTANATAIAQKQVALAGARLAAVLEAELQ